MFDLVLRESLQFTFIIIFSPSLNLKSLTFPALDLLTFDLTRRQV